MITLPATEAPLDGLVFDQLPPPSWPTLPATLAEICLCLTEALPSVESAGVVVFPADSPRSGPAPTLDGAELIGAAPAGSAVLELERQFDEGPVLTACRTQSVVNAPNIGADERWRRFGPAVAELQLRSAVSVPLPGIDGAITGALSLYSHQQDAFDDRALHLIGAVSDVARYALLSATMLEAMSAAWDRSRVLNQAIGVLMHGNCTEDEARSRLARMASRNQEDVTASARAVVEEVRKEAHLSFIASRHALRRAHP